MLADPAFREEVAAGRRATRTTVTVDAGRRDGMSVGRRPGQQPPTGCPSFAKKFVGDEINIVPGGDLGVPDEGDARRHHPRQARRDDGRGHAGRGRRGRPSRPSTSTIEVGIPLVGGKIEDLIADMLRKALKVPRTVGKWLAGSADLLALTALGRRLVRGVVVRGLAPADDVTTTRAPRTGRTPARA